MRLPIDEAPEEVRNVAACIMATIRSIHEVGGAVPVQFLHDAVMGGDEPAMTEAQYTEMMRQFTAMGVLTEDGGLFILSIKPDEAYTFGFDVNQILKAK